MSNAEIQVGEYVRTKNGVVRKVEEVLKGNYVNIDDGFFDTDYDGYRWGLEPDEIKAHSLNLTDLIEVGDYVNGHLVVDVDNINTGVMREVYCEDDKDMGLWNEHIETIVTKEQFKSMEYKVGGEDDSI